MNTYELGMFKIINAKWKKSIFLKNYSRFLDYAGARVNVKNCNLVCFQNKVVIHV